ncbi:MAG: hypothetical protein HP491_09085 [Nitrospira sp.]|nr:hypothetical protein [Nitrospira sp.]
MSFFYAEVKRLKTILDATQDRTAPPVLFLIDEIFKGTNNRERLIGSRTFIMELARGNGLGLVTTHDLELTDLDKTVPQLTNAHFQETVDAGALQFDYTLAQAPARRLTRCGSWSWKDCRYQNWMTTGHRRTF